MIVSSMEVEPIQVPLIHPGDDVIDLMLEALKNARRPLRGGDLLVVASKILATAEGRVVDLSTLHPTGKARKLATRYGMEPAHVQAILDESDGILGGIHKTLITLKRDVLIANGGVDKSNAPPNHVVLWPSDPDAWASRIRSAVRDRFRVEVGVIVADSRVHPLRIGTIGCAIGVAGFDPIKEYRGVIDLYGKPLLISRLAVADDIASAAHLLMGEAAERIGVAVVRDAPFVESETKSSADMVIAPRDCLFMGSIFRYPKKLHAAKVNST